MYLDKKTFEEISEKTKLDILTIQDTINRRNKPKTVSKTNINDNKKISIEKEILEIKKNVNDLKNTVEKMFVMAKRNHDFITLLVKEKINKISELVEHQEDENEKIKTIDELQENEYLKDDSDTSSSKSVKTYKINGIKCIKEGDSFYDFDNKKLFAITNDEGEIELVEEEKEEYDYITIGKKKYILIDENVYTIANDEPDELYGTYINRKFTKTNKIIVKGRKQQEKTEEELEAELG